MTLRVTILGCGTSTGVPRLGNDWGQCDPANPRNRRRRCAILVERRGPDGATRVLVDTPPDLREQLLDAEVADIDAVFFSHDHADHTHGIDDLRIPSYRKGGPIDVYLDARTADILVPRFRYCFETPPGGDYPPIVKARVIAPDQPVCIDGEGGAIEVCAFRQCHGRIETLGFRFGGLAYSSDINGLPEDSAALLAGLEVWIVDALRYRPHPTHYSLEEALAAIARVAPRRAILTHMHIDLDYATLRRELPEGVEPAFDGMVIEVPG